MKIKFISVGFSLLLMLSKASIAMDFSVDLPEDLRDVTLQNVGTITSLAGNETAEISLQVFPRNSHDVMKIVEWVKDKADIKLVVTAGSFQNNGIFQGLSLGGHAQGLARDVYISTQYLKRVTLENYKIDEEENTITLKVGAGNSWKETIALADESLNEGDRKKFRYLPFSSPTSRDISIGGSLTSHAHSRSSLFGGGYMPDAVKSFKVVTIQNNEVTHLKISREENADLFDAIPGSFGRGGIITSVTLTLQKVPKKSRVLTKVKKITDKEVLFEEFTDTIDFIKKDLLSCPPFQKPFYSTCVTIDAFGNYYLFTSSLVDKKQTKKDFKLTIFEKPNVITDFCHHMAHYQPKFAANMVSIFLVNPGKEFTKYKNTPDCWIFMQDSYLKFNKEMNHEISHQSYVIPRKYLREAMEISKDLQKDFNLTCKLEDILPVPPSGFIMSPAYQANDDCFIYTFTWPIENSHDKQLVSDFKMDFLQRCNEACGDGIVRPHMLKEFDSNSDLLSDYYQDQGIMLEEALDKNNINDSFLWNKIIGALYPRLSRPSF